MQAFRSICACFAYFVAPEIHSHFYSSTVDRMYEVGWKFDELIHEIERKNKKKVRY
jgi:hypothetical protein